MGSYAYCTCGRGLYGPWDLTTKDLLNLILTPDYELKCNSCNTLFQGNDVYYKDDIVEELVNRIDHIKE